MSEILRLSPAFKDYLWGGVQLKEKYGIKDMDIVAESWVLSTHKDGQSTIAEGKYINKTLSEAVSLMGKDCLGKNASAFSMFPMMIKLIDAEKSLSIQVHPSDEYALKNEGQYGKTEMWYILDAKEGAGIYYGVKKECTKDELLSAINENRIDDVLNFIPCKAGECYFIPAGTIHAIGAGLLIAEVQQNSNVTYRVYDYGRVGADGKPRELHTEKALEVSRLSPMENQQKPSFKDEENGKCRLLCSCEYFETAELTISGEHRFAPRDSFCCVLITKGSGTINGMPFNQYDTFFVPADTKEVVLNGDFKALISYVPSKNGK